MESLSEQVSSTENKHLLWALLSEENIFAGLRDDAVPLVINIFETAINTTSNACIHITQGHNHANALAELNKDVIQRVISDVLKYKASVVAQKQTAEAIIVIEKSSVEVAAQELVVKADEAVDEDWEGGTDEGILPRRGCPGYTTEDYYEREHIQQAHDTVPEFRLGQLVQESEPVSVAHKIADVHSNPHEGPQAN